jgi:hypothetical protein
MLLSLRALKPRRFFLKQIRIVVVVESEVNPFIVPPIRGETVGRTN